MKETWSSMVERRSVTLLIVASSALTLLIFVIIGKEQAPWRLGANRLVNKDSSILTTATAFLPNDKFLGGLLSRDFSEQSCLSRYRIFSYRKESDHILSSYLRTKLRKYEELHRKCGPYTALFKKSVERLNSNQSTDQLECNYVLWSPMGGLGNRMLTITSTFLYALLTNRVMLIDRAVDFVDLFCEPFPYASWVLPPDFPMKGLNQYEHDSNQSYSYMLTNNIISDDPDAHTSTLPPFVFVHLQHSYIWGGLHQLFFCDRDQFSLRKFNWMLIRSDNYFLPALFMIEQYEEELNRMFPSKETIFHHLGRYLFNPSNQVWEMITSYYNSSLVTAKEKIGIQVRDFMWSNITFENRFDQIMNCTRMANILPEVNLNQRETNPSSNTSSSKAVVVTSLSGDYYKKMVEYYSHPTTNNEQIVFYQPSHEGYERNEDLSHNKKALADIILLSFSDVFVTSAQSTFGYVSYGLSGTRPWLLLSRKDGKLPDPSCIRVLSIDPCFHSPPCWDCKNKKVADTGRMVRHVQHCQDAEDGVQLVD